MKLLTGWAFFANSKVAIPHVFKGMVVCVIFLLSPTLKGQILFTEECFKGGVLTCGAETWGAYKGNCEIEWQPHYNIRKAYAMTYRYGRPAPFTVELNNAPVTWSLSNQAGPEQIEVNQAKMYFAPHLCDITDQISISNNLLEINLSLQPFNSALAGEGWWGVYLVVFYESAQIDADVCIRQYVANQPQYVPQNYSFSLPQFDPNKPVVFAIHSGRLSEFIIDASQIELNSNIVGTIFSPDLLQPMPTSGVHGHFSYRNGEVLAFNGDTANTTLNRHDGTAIINGYLNTANVEQNLSIFRIYPAPFGGANPHPSFVIAYTPSCPVLDFIMERKYSYCLGSSVQMQAAPDFDNYSWEPQTGLSNAGISNPVCSATQSGWYRVRMWSTGPDAPCEQTIPVFVTVHNPPRAFGTSTGFSLCHNATGSIAADSLGGAGPYSFALNSASIEGLPAQNLGAGNYLLSITDANACAWDSTFNVQSIIVTNAAFTANPTDGESPLDVQFQDQSAQVNTWLWEANGLPFSSQQNPFYTFADTGTYTVSLIAYLNDPACADTAAVTIRVNPGIRIALPNIFTPNGDGTNDRLIAELFGVSSMRWEVYNRWGNLLYSGDDSSGAASVEIWDGADVPAGVYPVVLTATGINGKTETMQVMVTVVH